MQKNPTKSRDKKVELLLLTDNIDSHSQFRELSEIFKVIITNYYNKYFLIIKLVKITTMKRRTLKLL